MKSHLLIDTHVHLYPGFDRTLFLDSAIANFEATDPGAQGCLLLSETPREGAFESLLAGVVPAHWRAESLPDDPAALRLIRTDGVWLWVFAGAQSVSAEGLELLSPCTRERPHEGGALRRMLADAAAQAQPTILPWGVGKWLGRRGRLLRTLVQEGLPEGALLGDNAGRPGLWPVPGLFQAGLPVLPGSDPLPVMGAERQVGRYGIRVNGMLDARAPARDLRARLFGLRDMPPWYGARVGTLVAFRQQLALRRGRGAAA